MDGFDAGGKRAVVIGATNRKVDLDPALMSRFDLVGAGQNSFAGAQ
jgi:ATP-dependent 26S proteasome regulatory subunit